MFSRDSNKPNNPSSSSSVIGTEMQINGNIKCSGSLVLKGIVKGNVECDNISIASEGRLKGNIQALQSSIGGNFALLGWSRFLFSCFATFLSKCFKESFSNT